MVTVPPPMPAFLRWVTGMTAAVLGLGYVFGGSQLTSSESFYFLRQTPVPFPFWGAVFIIGGILIMLNQLVGYFVAVVAWGFWEGCFVMAFLAGHLNAWGAVVWPGFFVVLNAFQIWKWSMDRALRRTERMPVARHGRSG